jgi:hypothetical protein
MNIWIKKNKHNEPGSEKLNNKYNKTHGMRKGVSVGAAIIHKIGIANK